MDLLRCLFGVEAAAAAITALRHVIPLDAAILDAPSAPPVAAAAAAAGGAGAAAASAAIEEMRAHFAAVKLAPRRVSAPLCHSLLAPAMGGSPLSGGAREQWRVRSQSFICWRINDPSELGVSVPSWLEFVVSWVQETASLSSGRVLFPTP